MNNFKKARNNAGLTQQQVAQVLNIDRVSYARYESGTRQPDLASLIKLADLYHVSTDYLLGRQPEALPELTQDKAPDKVQKDEPDFMAAHAKDVELSPQMAKAVEKYISKLLKEKGL